MSKTLIGLAAALAVAGGGGVTVSTLPMLIVNADSHATGCPAAGACVSLELRVAYEGAGGVVRSSSLGTLVAPGVILTHNHHSLLNRDPAPEGLLVVTEATGTAWLVVLSDLILQPLDAGTLLIRLPDDVQLSSTSPLATATLGAGSIQPGDRLTVSYRNPATDALATAPFEVTEVLKGRVKLADPLLLIRSGDSGGGAFMGGALIGNTWSIDRVEGQPIGSFTVALLSETTAENVSALSLIDNEPSWADTARSETAGAR